MAADPSSGTARQRDVLELIATLLLAVAAVATAWASYQATRWNGEQVRASSRTTALRIEAARAADLADSQTEIDVATFIQWIDATAIRDDELAQFYEARFRPEFEPAFEAWLATDPLNDPAAPPTPFAMDEYQLAARADATDLDRQSEASAAIVLRNVRRSADFVLAVVLFAASLFFAGISTKVDRMALRAATLGIGCLLFLGTVVWVATLPMIVGT
jgi:hypothetical protein